jgi:hypothetical protein
MSVMRPEGSIGYEWKTDLHPRCGSVQDVVNTTNHLWPISLRPDVRVVPFRPEASPSWVDVPDSLD